MKPRSTPRPSLRPRVLALSVAACFAAAPAWPLPTGPQVVAGSAALQQAGNTLNIANTPGAIINWNAFSIGANEAVRFQQQHSLSSVLNRVTGGDVSRILGELTSNGRVWLINPNGILFGAGSRVDVNGLIASTLNVSNADFLAGRMNFAAGDKAGRLENAGTLNAANNIYLIAPDIENSGIVRSAQGEVLLAAGREVSLVDAAHPDIQVVVSAPTDKAVNLGELVAGKISVFGALVKHKGTANANRVEVDDHGRIVFRASGDTLVEGGKVSATHANDQGGRIEILGNRVAVTGGTEIDATGTTGGGTILVGGDYQGKNPDIPNAQVTYFGPDAILKANAEKVGDGGTAIVWADDTTRAYGRIEAKGGAAGGDGGFVEVSGKQNLIYRADTDTRAPMGKTGTLLLDPVNITIQAATPDIDGSTSGATDDITNASQLDSAVSDYPGADSVITSGALVGLLNTTNVALDAGNDITVTSGINWSFASLLTLNAGQNITLGGTIDSGGLGSLTLNVGQSGAGGTLGGSATISNNTVLQINGGAGNDTFNLSNITLTNNSTALINGYAGADTLAATNAANAWVITAANAGTLNGTATFSNMETLTGGTGIDTLTGLAAGDSYSITGTNAVTLTTGAMNATSIDNLAGGAGADSFNGAGGSLSGYLSDGDGATTLSGNIQTGGAQTYTGAVSAAAAISLTSSGGAISATNAANDFTGTVTASGNGIQITDANALTVVLNDSGSSTINAGGNLVVSGNVTTGTLSTTTTGTGTTSFGATNAGTALISHSAGAITIDGNLTGSGMISLTSTGGSVTQPSGTIAGGTSVYAEGTRVILAGNNGPGVIAGKATGSSTGDIFSYASINGISVTTVDGFSGIQTASPTNDVSVILSAGNGNSIIQTAPIIAGGGTKGLSLSTTGPVELTLATNSVGSLTATGVGSLIFKNAGALTTKELTTISNGTINVSSAGGLITLQDNINAGTGMIGLEAPNIQLGVASYGGPVIAGGQVKLRANQPSTGAISMGGTTTVSQINAAAIALEADNFALTVAPLPSLTATSAIRYTNATDNAPLSVNGFSSVPHSTPWLVIGNDVVADPNTTGTLTLNASINNITGGVVLLAQNSINQTAGILAAQNLGFRAGTGVDLGNNGNSIGVLAGSTASGPINFANVTGFNVGTVSHGSLSATGLNSGSGVITLQALAGNIGLASPINAGTGSVSITAQAGSIVDANTTSGNVTADSATFSAYGGIGTLADPIETQVGTLNASKDGMGESEIAFANSRDMTAYISGGMNSSVSLFNAGSITAASSGITAGGGTTTVVASGASSDITVPAMKYVGGSSVTLNAGRDVLVNGGSVSAGLANATITAGRDVKVNAASGYNASIAATTDVSITASTGKLYLNSSGANNAKVESQSVNTVYLNVPGVSTAGYVIDGVEGGDTVSTLNSSTGIFVAGAPAVPDSTFMVTNAPPPTPEDPCVINPASCLPPPPTMDQCTANPTLSGCAAVLPTLDTCVATPTAPGCTAVLPSIATCTATPTAPGCAAVLPSIDTCVAAPTAPGCTAVLPSISECATNPTAPGCTAVLPPLDTCVATPTAPGCAAVLPSMATCTATPTAPGCAAVLPPLDTCVATPTAPGCSVVLPPLDTCIGTPTAPGCSAVLPTVADCTSNASLPGCIVVLPASEQRPVTQASNEVVNQIQSGSTLTTPAGLQLVSQAPAAGSGGGGGGGGGSGSGEAQGTSPNQTDEKDKDEGKGKDNEQQPAGGEKANEKPKKNYCN